MARFQPTDSIIDCYDVKRAAGIAGLSVDMVNYLCRNKIVVPSGGKRRGRGTARKYSFADVLLLRVMEKLLAQGISVLRLKKCIISLQKRGGRANELVSRKYIATDGVEIYIGDSEVLELLSTGQLAFAFVLELSSIREQISMRIASDLKVANGAK